MANAALPVLYRVDQPNSNVVVFRGAQVAQAQAAGLLPGGPAKASPPVAKPTPAPYVAPTTPYVPPPPPTTTPPPTTVKPAPPPTPAYRPAPTPAYRPAPIIYHKPAPTIVYKPAPPVVYKPVPKVVYKPAPAPAYKPAPATYAPAYANVGHLFPIKFKFKRWIKNTQIISNWFYLKYFHLNLIVFLSRLTPTTLGSTT